MFGAGKPKILEWKLLKDALSGIGLLKYYAGDFGDGQDSSLEYVAIVDTRANKVISIEPHAWGASPAQWNWQAVSVVVTDPDGNKNEVQLRKVRQRAPVARDDFWGFERADSPPGAKPPPRWWGRGGGGRRAEAVAACSIGCSGDPVSRQRARRRGSRARDRRRRRHRRSERSRPRRAWRACRPTPSPLVSGMSRAARRSAPPSAISLSQVQRSCRRAGDRSLGVDYVKLGIFPGGDAERCLRRLRTTPANSASSSSCSPMPCPNSMPSRSPPGSARMA